MPSATGWWRRASSSRTRRRVPAGGWRESRAMPPKGKQSSAKKSTGTKGGARKRVGTGGHGRDRLAGKKPTLPAEQRTGHPAKRRADHETAVAEKRRAAVARDA